ncbi:MAG TPA: hypothetical protein VHA52_04510 [Candidatus Babeliaceae bacterium]|nr:hypothetical protein [Candidatus Babeliaceae bacterium]
MKSTIRVEFDFTNGQPYLQAKVDTQSDDLRDKALQNFIERVSISDQTIFAFFENVERDGLSTVNIIASNNAPEWAVNQRVDNMKSWSRQFFQESEMEPFEAFFDALSKKASLKTINKK